MSNLRAAPLCLEKTALSAYGIVERGRSAFGLEPEEDHTVRNTTMGIVMAYPLAIGAVNRRGAVPLAARSSNDFSELERALRPGDVLVSGSPRTSELKTMISSVNADPDYQHVGTYLGKNGGGHQVADTVNNGSFGVHGASGLSGDRNVRVLRFKDPNDLSRLNLHMGELANAQTPYSTSRGVKAGLKELLLPDFLRSNGLVDAGVQSVERAAEHSARGVNCHGGICSNVVATAVPERFRGKNALDVLPGDILRAGAFDTVYEYRPSPERVVGDIFESLKTTHPRLSEDALVGLANKTFRKEQAINKVLAHGKTLSRLGLGAAGAGLVYGGARLPASDLSAGEAVAGLGMLGLGATPLLHKQLAKAGRTRYLSNINKDLASRTGALVAKGLSQEQVSQALLEESRSHAESMLRSRGITNVSVNDLLVDASPGRGMYAGTSAPGIDFSVNSGDPARKVRGVVRSPAYKDTILHELGHAEDYQKRLSDPEKFLRYVGKEAPTEGSWRAAWRTLVEETSANRNALQHVYNTDGLRSAIRSTGNQLPGYATYVADMLKHLKIPGAALGVGGAGLLGYNLLSDKREED